MNKKIYKLTKIEARSYIDLRHHLELIKSCYSSVLNTVIVECDRDSYTIIGNFTNGELRAIGRLIARNTELGKCVVNRGTGRSLFTCVEQTIVSVI